MNTNILDFGADPKGQIPSTGSINRAIIACSESGGGYVECPAGTYLCGTLFLQDHVILHLHPGCTILGSLFFSDYSGPARGCQWGNSSDQLQGTAAPSECRALIIADRKNRCGIIGHGTIDGRRSTTLGMDGEKGRPFLVVFSECTHATLRDVTMTNSGMFTFYGLNCSDLKIDGVTIRTEDCPNGDGLDFDGGKRISISNCNIDAGDDAIGLKTLTPDEPCEDFTITNCHLRAKNWAAVRIGPESAGDMRRITVSNCCFHDCGDGFKLQLTQNAVFEDFCFSNITMKDVMRPIFFTKNSYNMSRLISDIRPQTGIFRRVKMSHIIAQMKPGLDFGTFMIHTGNYISALPGDVIEDITLHDIHFIACGGGSAEEAVRTTGHGEMYDFWKVYPEDLVNMGQYPSAVLYVRNARNIKMRDCTFAAAEYDARAAIAAECVENLCLDDCEARNCGGLLRHYRCISSDSSFKSSSNTVANAQNDIAYTACVPADAVSFIRNCIGDIIPFSQAQAAAWESFHTLSLKVEQKLEELVQSVEKIKTQDILLYSDTCDFTLPYDIPAKNTVSGEDFSSEIVSDSGEDSSSEIVSDSGEVSSSETASAAVATSVCTDPARSLVIPRFAGDFALFINDCEVCRFEIPDPYRSIYPFATEITKYLVPGDNRISIRPLTGFELLSRIQIRTTAV